MKQKEIKDKEKKGRTKSNTEGEISPGEGGKAGKGAVSSGIKFPEEDIHCLGMTFHGKIKVDKYGNYQHA